MSGPQSPYSDSWGQSSGQAPRTTLPFSFDLEPKLRWLVAVVVAAAGTLLFYVHEASTKHPVAVQHVSTGSSGLGAHLVSIVSGFATLAVMNYFALSWYPRIYAIGLVVILISAVVHEGFVFGAAETTFIVPAAILAIRLIPWLLQAVFLGGARTTSVRDGINARNRSAGGW